MQIDSALFLGLAAALVLVTRALPRSAALWAHAGVSLAVFLWVLPGWPSTFFALGFLAAPPLLGRALGPARAVTATIVVQAAAVLWLRRYPSMIPGLGDLAPFAHTLAVAGVSYIVLRQIQWALHRDEEPDERFELSTYLGFLIGGFTLLAGPIVPFAQWRDGFRAADDRLDVDVALAAGHRIVRGYFKVAVIAPVLAGLSSVAAVEQAGWSLPARALSLYAYPFFIYLNFAGYCDVVIGLAALAGQRLPENFDSPFKATNVQEFWQRWHITFSNWVRDHISYPVQLRLRRRRWPGSRALVVSVMSAFAFVGLWHGAQYGFALFGLVHGLAVLAVPAWGAVEERLIGERGAAWLADSRGGFAVRWLLCFHFLCASIALFDRTPAQALRLLTG